MGNLIALALSNWKLLLNAGIFLFGLISGWHIHAVITQAGENKQANKIIATASNTETKLFEFNSDLGKFVHEKDDCFNAPIPADLLKLLK